jgi:hypothetical protein
MEDNKMNIKVFNKPCNVQGFNFKEGFVALLDENNNILAATSGWETGGKYLYVYRPQNGGWIGSWEDEETFPVAAVADAIADYEESKDLAAALADAEGKELFISDTDLVFTDVVPGKKCHNGGEYGFYTRYRPIPEYPGIYRVYTETTCDFDACGTGYEGITALTIAEYRKLLKKSDEIEAAGSLY